jgi:hypothetical protein
MPPLLAADVEASRAGCGGGEGFGSFLISILFLANSGSQGYRHHDPARRDVFGTVASDLVFELLTIAVALYVLVVKPVTSIFDYYGRFSIRRRMTFVLETDTPIK